MNVGMPPMNMAFVCPLVAMLLAHVWKSQNLKLPKP
jgi:hypothetical protein